MTSPCEFCPQCGVVMPCLVHRPPTDRELSAAEAMREKHRSIVNTLDALTFSARTVVDPTLLPQASGAPAWMASPIVPTEVLIGDAMPDRLTSTAAIQNAALNALTAAIWALVEVMEGAQRTEVLRLKYSSAGK
jgi:hypothetical protein